MADAAKYRNFFSIYLYIPSQFRSLIKKEKSRPKKLRRCWIKCASHYLQLMLPEVHPGTLMRIDCRIFWFQLTVRKKNEKKTTCSWPVERRTSGIPAAMLCNLIKSQNRNTGGGGNVPRQLVSSSCRLHNKTQTI